MDISEFTTDFFSLAGKTAIVTGGNGGLGRAFSLALAAAGANVFVPSLADDDGETARLIEAHGREYAFVQSDITAAGEPDRVVRACV
ncbi:SDR family NAD(P)-dependent oxidoreductase, partial [Streptomyces brasiliscabiei]|uniref:SDR family NAD(P)-dependent oxidoreductase n=1 Tax=Streptomyces brasiliscabiei TaxID=2736302 RepID=UPI0030142B1B